MHLLPVIHSLTYSYLFLLFYFIFVYSFILIHSLKQSYILLLILLFFHPMIRSFFSTVHVQFTATTGENMHMLPRDHPSGRHSAVDWSKPDLDKYPNFGKVIGNEVILQPGDFLYIPTYWHHYIVSLNVNFQCNTRSGRTSSFDKYISKCGF